MENEEGMNHLWIHVLRDEGMKSQQCEIEIRLPQGLYRSYNLNELAENERGHILTDGSDQEVMIEIFTENPISCGERLIAVTLFYSSGITVSKEVTVEVVEEAGMDGVELDERVVERVKAIRGSLPPTEERTGTVTILPQILERRDNKYSYLEKEYRIDYEVRT
ncbi:hypothetical protein ACE6ED_19085 [Paenibacillus sp. CN-4]|uniref:hypothetical protein n=1 Tax=Paenibacillus nanchangensis TaxID=3348343 RepID=UPI0039790396